MAATLLAVILALVVGHLLPALAAGVRRFGWFAAWRHWLYAQPSIGGVLRSGVGIFLLLLPPILLLGVLQFSLWHALLGLPSLLLGLLVLFWSWGPRDLDVDVEAVLAAPDTAARRRAAAPLQGGMAAPSLDGPKLIEAVFSSARQRWFGTLFWFCLLGPTGALLYRLSVLSVNAQDEALPAPTVGGARTLLAILDWPVNQLMALTLALVGSFAGVANAWREAGALGLHGQLLANAARASVRGDIAEEVADYTESGVSASTALVEVFGELPELREAMNLVWRMLTLWLAVLALFVVAGWVG